MTERLRPPAAGRRRGAAADTRHDTLHGRQDRARIAEAAARLIVMHGLDDWALAKRKAARQLALPESTPCPSNDEIEAALAEYQALFGGAEQRATLRLQRQRAREWMRRLEAWAPLLVGGVAAGWASAHNDARIELATDDSKAVEMLLAGQGIRYQAAGGQESGRGAVLLIIDGEVAIRLEIVTPNERRHRSRREAAVRLDAVALGALLDAPD